MYTYGYGHMYLHLYLDYVHMMIDVYLREMHTHAEPVWGYPMQQWSHPLYWGKEMSDDKRAQHKHLPGP